MVITACGTGCFRIQIGGTTLLVEPFTGEVSARFKPDIVLKTRFQPGDFNPEPEPFMVVGPGQYELREIEIVGSAEGDTGSSATNYLVSAEGLRLGFYATAAVTPLEFLEDADVLFLLGGGAAAVVVKQLEPRLVVPFGEQAAFLAKAFGQQPTPQEKLVLKKSALPAVGPQMILLTS